MYQATVAGFSILFAQLISPELPQTQFQNLVQLLRFARDTGIHRSFLLTDQERRFDEEESLGIVSDHINLTGINPLVGHQKYLPGPRFPDMSHVYPNTLQKILWDTLESHSTFPIGSGILVGLREHQRLLSRERSALSGTGQCYFTLEGIFESIIMGAAGIQVAGLVYCGKDFDETVQPAILKILSPIITDLIKKIF